jgi:excisionase family DNA binding protein
MCEYSNINLPEEFESLQDQTSQLSIQVGELSKQLAMLRSELQEVYTQAITPARAYTKSEACEILQVTMLTLDKILKSAKLKSFVVGDRGIRISRSNLHDYMADNQRS